MTWATAVLLVAVLAGGVGNVRADHGTSSPRELPTRITVTPELGVSRDCPKYNRKRQYKAIQALMWYHK